MNQSLHQIHARIAFADFIANIAPRIWGLTGVVKSEYDYIVLGRTLKISIAARGIKAA